MVRLEFQKTRRFELLERYNLRIDHEIFRDGRDPVTGDVCWFVLHYKRKKSVQIDRFLDCVYTDKELELFP